MSRFFWDSVFVLTIFIPGVISVVRFNRINKVYYPFLYCIWVGCVNELLSVIRASHGRYTTVNNNVYVLIEALLLTWLFDRLGIFKRKAAFFIMIGILIASWILENFVFGRITANSTYFRILYSFALVLMSITVLNDLVTSDKKNLLRNATFLLCCTFIAYFTYKVLTQAFLVYGLYQSRTFTLSVYAIMKYINLGANLVYGLAVLWMPRKIGFTFPL
jgi:hypothetical protein